MKVRIGTAGTPACSVERSSLAGVRVVRELGLDAMEVEYTYGVRMDLRTAKEVGAAAKESRVKLSVHAPYYINLCSADAKKLKASKQRILDSAERGAAMGAHVIVFHPGFYGKMGLSAYDAIRDSCAELCDALRSRGWNVLLGLETTGKQGQFGTLDENIRIATEVRGCVPVVDWSHLYARGGGHADFGGVVEKIKALKLGELHSHFSGIEYSVVGAGKGNERRHAMLGQKDPGMETVAREVLKHKLDATFICESPIMETDALRMKSVFEKLGYEFKK